MDLNYCYKISWSLTRLIKKLAAQTYKSTFFSAVDDISLYYVASLDSCIKPWSFSAVDDISLYYVVSLLFSILTHCNIALQGGPFELVQHQRPGADAAPADDLGHGRSRGRQVLRGALQETGGPGPSNLDQAGLFCFVVFAGLRLNNAWASGTVLRPFLQPESPLSSRSLVSGFKCKLRDSNSRPQYSRPRALTTRLYTIHNLFLCSRPYSWTWSTKAWRKTVKSSEAKPSSSV